jgi:hemerythrin
MAIQWTSALETGHHLIDSQHRELINVINQLLEACIQGQAADKIAPTVEFLDSYTKKHFSEEEALQQKSHYPDYENHRKLHADFLKVVAELSAELKQTGLTPTLTNKIVRNVGGWLTNHIQQQDTKVAAHLKSAGG